MQAVLSLVVGVVGLPGDSFTQPDPGAALQAEATPDVAGAWAALRKPPPADEAGEGVTASAPCEVYAYKGGQGSGPQPSVRWTADGDQVLFTYGTAVFKVAADGSWLKGVVNASETVFVGPSRLTTIRAPYFDVSSDGRKVLYAACRSHLSDGRDPEIAACLYSREDTGVRECDYPITGSIEYPAAEVAFLLGADLYEIAVLDVASGERERLFVGNAAEWSPDGERIAFISKYNSSYPLLSGEPTGGIQPRLYTMAADGTDIRRVGGPRNMSVSHPPRWSSNGLSLAFVGDVGELEMQPSVYTVDANGSHLKRLSEALSEPSWSPDGERIALAKRNGDEVALYTVAADGTDARLVTAIGGWSPDSYLPDSWVGTLAWSPAGTQILHTCGERVCVVGVDGTLVGRSPVTFEDGVVAAWSPDGNRIAVSSVGRPNQHGTLLYTMAPDGTNDRVLVRASGAGLVAENSVAPDVTTEEACSQGHMVEDPEENAGLVQDCETLIELRDAFLGEDALNWNTGVPIDEWWGVTVGGTPPRVTGLTLGGGLRDHLSTDRTLPSAIGDLTHLNILDLFGSKLSGPIPSELGNLTKLRILDLSRNYFWGPIPRELGKLVNLEILNLSVNDISDPIPPELGNLANLRVLAIASGYSYGLTGAIPAELGRLSNLTEIYLYGNELTGAIPTELGELASLKKLYLHYTKISGAIPTELGKLVNLRVLRLDNNDLTGEIPGELGRLPSLTTLNLGNNQLTGVVPAELGGLSNLTELDLADNQLEGTIPAELGRPPNMKVLHLRGNQLTGCIPEALRRIRNDDLWFLRIPYCDQQSDGSGGWLQGVASAVTPSVWWALLALPLAATAVVVVRLAKRRRSGPLTR